MTGTDAVERSSSEAPAQPPANENRFGDEENRPLMIQNPVPRTEGPSCQCDLVNSVNTTFDPPQPRNIFAALNLERFGQKDSVEKFILKPATWSFNAEDDEN